MENRVEQYIKDYTRNCSNEQGGWSDGKYIVVYHPWLTPDNARRAAEIAREEVIDKAVEWLKEKSQNYVYWMDEEFGKEDLIEDFKKYMEESI